MEVQGWLTPLVILLHCLPDRDNHLSEIDLTWWMEGHPAWIDEEVVMISDRGLTEILIEMVELARDFLGPFASGAYAPRIVPRGRIGADDPSASCWRIAR